MIFDVTQPAVGTRGLASFAPAAPDPAPADGAKPEVSFWDLVDVINPLQHIPVVSTIYRQITGDEIGAGAKLAGSFLFGGVLGLGSAVANLAVEAVTGDDVEGHLMGLIDDTSSGPQNPLEFARARNAYERVDSMSGAIEEPYERDIPC